MIIFNPRPWGRDGNEPIPFLREHMLGPDSGVAVFFDEKTEVGKGSTFDSHGNHDALPPSPDYPAGRIFTGSNVFPSTAAFYAAQEAQPPLALKTDWLTVGHIDETYAPVAAATPRGWKLLQNTPSLGKQLFDDWEKQGHGDAVVFEGLSDFSFHQWQTTVKGVNDDAELQAWNQESQTHIDVMHDQLLEAGFTEDDIVPVPVIYEEIDGGKIAYLPDTANVRVINQGLTTIFPKPVGPMIDGEDAFRKWFEAYLKDPKWKLGKDGTGPIMRYGDSWDYHVLLGDIHCASNWTALPSKDEPRWWEGLQ
jgi:protein-arginine deiminase